MKPVSPELHRVLTAWLADATSAKPSFDATHYGLCSYVCNRNGMAYQELQRKLDVCFRDRAAYPFNLDTYYLDMKADTQHLDKRRRAWVRRVLRAGPADVHS